MKHWTIIFMRACGLSLVFSYTSVLLTRGYSLSENPENTREITRE